MKKVISYSLFGAKPEGEADSWEFLFYLRGFYFNVLMNSLVYPDLVTRIYIDGITFDKYEKLFRWLNDYHKVKFGMYGPDNLCRSMLWRMKPIFSKEVDIVICRDSDALTSYREAQAVEEWIQSGMICHGLHDNPAHSVPLMGGMCGFRANELREKYGSWEEMISKSPVVIDKRGSDQDFINHIVFRDFKDSFLGHYGDIIQRNKAYNTAGTMPGTQFKVINDDRSNRLWTSNLCSFFIGSAGVNEMETLRFFRDNLPGFGDDKELWAKYPKIFYWN